MSDLHNIDPYYDVPDGDILIIAGDICEIGNDEEISEFDTFLSFQNHAVKIVIAGNHDFTFQDYTPKNAKKLLKHGIYLEDSGIDIYGVKFWGSPWQPWFGGWAFNLPRGQKLADVWAQIPDDTDVLITHSPPFGILDVVNGEHVGCNDLTMALKRIRPRLHVFGHIHQGYGMTERNGTTYVNASLRDEEYKLVNQPIVVDL
ncbi:metallophosphatase domain-containing protein [Methylomonas sp. ZR1]|uniref:metallophosphatase domain-containing protein n=1 Tax=Methylomonas sp. ZR1 TaxID=1797072 RepID=UPI001C129233|nr:metallophosphatase domain-containing protein [Methylomonas sp. ZR1]